MNTFDSDFENAKHVPTLKMILQDLSDNKLDPNWFISLDPDTEPIASTNSRKRPSWATRKKNTVDKGPTIFIFMMGGICFNEIKACEDMEQILDRSIIIGKIAINIGSTHVWTPDSFVQSLKADRNFHTFQRELKSVESNKTLPASARRPRVDSSNSITERRQREQRFEPPTGSNQLLSSKSDSLDIKNRSKSGKESNRNGKRRPNTERERSSPSRGPLQINERTNSIKNSSNDVERLNSSRRPISERTRPDSSRNHAVATRKTTSAVEQKSYSDMSMNEINESLTESLTDAKQTISESFSDATNKMKKWFGY
jgi:flagellar biosynthesis GTPase FlhF